MIRKFRNTLIALVVLYIPLFIFVPLIETRVFVEDICGDQECNRRVCLSDDGTYYWDQSESGISYHYSSMHGLITKLMVMVYIIYFIFVVINYIKITYPKTWEEITG